MSRVRGALVTALAVVLLAPLLSSQEDDVALARSKAIDVHGRCVALLDGIDGVSSVSYAGSGSDYRLLISVRDYTVKQAAKQKLGGDTWEGLRILWTVTNPNFATPSTRTIAAPQASPSQDPPAPPSPGASGIPTPAAAPMPDIPDCDILRAQLGLPPVRHLVGGGSWKSWVPCKIWLHAVEGAGGGHSYLYTKHRPGCPFQDGLCSQVYREGFLYPFGLRGDDWNWRCQVVQDVRAKFPPPPPPMMPKATPYRPDTPTATK